MYFPLTPAQVYSGLVFNGLTLVESPRECTYGLENLSLQSDLGYPAISTYSDNWFDRIWEIYAY